jgi:ribose 5-phosphate isomerase A
MSEADAAVRTDGEKAAAAHAAAELVQEGMAIGLGTGSTVAYLLPALARRRLKDVAFAASSPATELAARNLGLRVLSLQELSGRLDLTIDGADQVAPDGWLVKGGGGAHAREKVLAVAAARFVVIVSENKLREALQPPVPLEITPFAAPFTLRALAPASLRQAPPSPEGNLIADYEGPIGDPRSLAARLAGTPGVLEHGLFEPELVSEILIGSPRGVERRPGPLSGA